MSLTKGILRIMAKYCPMGYPQLFEYLYKETVYGNKLNKDSVRSIVSRLEKGGLINKSNSGWSVTAGGKESLKEVKGIKKLFGKSNFIGNKGKSKNLIVIFDVPEKRKNYREWLRMELVEFGFIMIQKSVWFGPSLPKEFVEYLGEVGLLKHIRFFSATEKDLI